MSRDLRKAELNGNKFARKEGEVLFASPDRAFQMFALERNSFVSKGTNI